MYSPSPRTRLVVKLGQQSRIRSLHLETLERRLMLSGFKEVIQLTNDATTEANLAISGDHVVWSGGAESQTFLYDIGTGTTQQLTNTSTGWPAISGDRVVWSEGRVFLYDIGTGTTQQLTNDGYWAMDLAISGDYVVWLDGVDFSAAWKSSCMTSSRALPIN